MLISKVELNEVFLDAIRYSVFHTCNIESLEIHKDSLLVYGSQPLVAKLDALSYSLFSDSVTASLCF